MICFFLLQSRMKSLNTRIVINRNYKVTPFHGLLTELYDKGVKRIGKNYIITDEGKVEISKLDDEVKLLVQDYQLVVYDALFGSNYLTEIFFSNY